MSITRKLVIRTINDGPEHNSRPMVQINMEVKCEETGFVASKTMGTFEVGHKALAEEFAAWCNHKLFVADQMPSRNLPQ